MKGKPLLPTLRQKKRYVVYDYISEKELDDNKVFYAILSSFKELFGKLELVKANIKKIQLLEKSQKKKKNNITNETKIINLKILRINNKYLNHLRLAMANVYEIDGIKIIIYTTKTSGLINKIRKFLKNKKKED
ncbi:MAG: Rpp14/Pop5 family protein [Candidatus Woesearchaeota archaeon]